MKVWELMEALGKLPAGMEVIASQENEAPEGFSNFAVESVTDPVNLDADSCAVIYIGDDAID